MNTFENASVLQIFLLLKLVTSLKNSKWILLRNKSKGTFKVIFSFFPNVCTYSAYLELDSDLSTGSQRPHWHGLRKSHTLPFLFAY